MYLFVVHEIIIILKRSNKFLYWFKSTLFLFFAFKWVLSQRGYYAGWR